MMTTMALKMMHDADNDGDNDNGLDDDDNDSEPNDAADDADADYDAGSGDDDYDDAVARNIPLLTSDACLQALHTQYESSD